MHSFNNVLKNTYIFGTTLCTETVMKSPGNMINENNFQRLVDLYLFQNKTHSAGMDCPKSTDSNDM